MLLLVVVPLLLMVVLSIVQPWDSAAASQPVEGLFPIFFLVGLLLFSASWIKGCQTGGAFFRMADVNLLFTSSMRPQRILAFGLINQMAMILISAVFIVYQLPNLMRAYRISTVGILALIVGYLLLLLIGELISMALYILLSTRPQWRPVLARLPYAVALLIGIAFLWLLQREGQDLGRAWTTFSALPALRFVPPAGWLSAAIIAVIRGDLTQTLIFGGFLVALPIAILLWINRAQADYYEDVLLATEQKEQTLVAAREGRSVATATNFARYRRDQGGLGHGWGASAFFWRQLLVLRRRSRFGLISANLVVQIIAGFALVFVLRDQPDVLGWVYLPVALMYLFIAVRFNEWPQELRRPWLYIAPVSSGAKLFWATLPGPLKALYDALPYFIIIAIAGGVSAPAALAAWLLTGTFASLNVSAGMIIGRIFGQVSNKGMTSVLAMFLEYMLMTPTILSVVFGVLTGRSAILFAAGALVNILIYFVCWLIGRDMLHDHDE